VCAYVVVMAEAQIIVPIHVAVATFRDASAMPPSLLSQRLGALELGGRCVLYLLLVDVLQYWRHRALHRWPLLWRFHRLHHDDTAINSVTGRRDHWLNQFIYFLTVLAPRRSSSGRSTCRMP
jgi:sterol desaturase/sphingolipid hydroxylase (fatty acid hydroxylase superfamily)